MTIKIWSKRTIMYLPKFRRIYIPNIDINAFTISPEYCKEFTPIINRTWSEVSKIIWRDETRDGRLMRHHRGSSFIYGEQGYTRVAVFLNLLLHAVWKGRQIYSLLPVGIDAMNVNSATSATPSNNPALPHTGVPLNYIVSDEVRAAYQAIFNNVGLNTLNWRLLSIAELTEMVDVLADAPFLDSPDVGATFHNLIVFYLQIVRLLLLRPTDDAGNPIGINVAYTEHDLEMALLNLEFEPVFTNSLFAQKYNDIIANVRRVSLLGYNHILSSDGVKFDESFYLQLTDNIFSAAIEISTMLTEVRMLGRYFFDNVRRYSNLVRLNKYNPNLLPIKPKGGDEYLIFTDLEDVNVNKDELESFIPYFESSLSVMMTLWEQFVNAFYTKIDDLPAKGNPIIVGYFTEVAGVNQIYGMKYCAPYRESLYVVQNFPETEIINEPLSYSSNPGTARLKKTKVEDVTFRGINTRHLDSHCPHYLELVVRARANLVVNKADPMSEIYNLRWDDYFYLIIPPIDPVTDFKFRPGLIRFNRAADNLQFISSMIHVNDITIELLPFIIKAGDYSMAHNSNDNETALKNLYFTNFLSALKAEAFGVFTAIMRVNITRSLVVSLSSYLAIHDTVASNQVLHFLTTHSVLDNLRPNLRGVDVILNRDLVVPFPYYSNDSSQSQLDRMRQNYSAHIHEPVVAVDDTHDILTSSGVTIDNNIPYSIFSERHVLGFTRVRLGEHIAPNSKLIARGPESFGLRLTSLVKNFLSIDELTKETILSQGVLSLQNKNRNGYLLNEQDYFDPYPNDNCSDSIFNTLVSLITELSFNRISNVEGGGGDLLPASFALVRRHLTDIIDFLTDYYDLNGRVIHTANFDFDITWSTLRGHLRNVLTHDDNTLLTALQDALLTMRNNSPLFWNSNGFNLEPLFFGSLYSLLEDKYAHINRPPLEVDINLDLRHVNLPSLMPGTSSGLLKQIIMKNFSTLINNTLGKCLYLFEA